MRGRGERGQATVELLAVLPLVALCVALAWQAVVAGQAVWLVADAARAAARARALGADPAAGARSVLPGPLERGLRVRAAGADAVEVAVRVPAVVPGLGRLGTARARAGFEPQGG